MSGRTIAEFLAYWEAEGLAYAKRGDYDWMASLLPGQRVLEIGCGPGFGTEALLRRGLSVLSLDSLDECLAATAVRATAGAWSPLKGDVSALDAAHRSAIEAFAPESVVCWLMGAPAEVTGAGVADGGQAVVAYREKVHRQVAELAASLPGVRCLHIVDRTALPWQAKDIGRDTLVAYHLGKTLRDLPFAADRSRALYRKLGDGIAGRLPPGMKGAVPVLASLLAERKS